jgi:nucleoside 2-deoxyribosyltransferase
MYIDLNTKPKPFCFILMPFDKAFDETYNLIRSCCENADTFGERVSEQIFDSTILERIYNQISKADIIIADMSGKNPNVFYEVGYAHALGKKTILLTQKIEDIPFDLKGYPHIEYKRDSEKFVIELQNKIEYFVANPEITEKNYKIEFEVYYQNFRLSDDELTVKCRRDVYPQLNFTLFNPSNYTFSPNELSIGIITESFIYDSETANHKTNTISLPDGSIFHLLLNYDKIFFPSSYVNLNFRPIWNLKGMPDSTRVKLRIYTSAGYRDFMFILSFSL